MIVRFYRSFSLITRARDSIINARSILGFPSFGGRYRLRLYLSSVSNGVIPINSCSVLLYTSSANGSHLA